ncbi:MAG: aspartate 1-decarboxylase [Armatimonadetes bacterium]|nr:aspartate 1-decarboxylase [Armatimonadota bacterium]
MNLCKGKIHRAAVTCTDVNYEGSISIDQDLLDAAGILDGEFVHVWNVSNGDRFETYAIPAARGSGEICVNGAAARRCEPGDKVIIVAFVLTDEPVARRVVLVDDQNRITDRL